MPGKTPAERAALETQAAVILRVFEAAGFAHIAPDILQPADVFLDRAGEEIRARTFVFTDPAGTELCLRPDLTVPACRYHLSHASDPQAESRYCYQGPAFRFQPEGGSPLYPSEFDQAGIEWFGAADAERADAEILGLAMAAMAAAGLARYRVRIGDLGLVRGLLHSIDMPERWRRRLMHQFWRPRAFRSLLDQLTGTRSRPRTSISPLLGRLAGGGLDEAVGLVTAELDQRSAQLAGGRTIDDIAGRLAEKAADRHAPPLEGATAALIDDYLGLRGRPESVLGDLERLAIATGGAMPDAVARFRRRLEHIEAGRHAPDDFEFSGVFGRNLEYYTGFVFQIEVDRPQGGSLAIAGGGRYDNMLTDIGAAVAVPAVGCAIHTERLLAAAQGDLA
ncbi:MAG: ATP phosphoribosyltransferase regulatory subunit [Hyphomicrobiales bacterium]